MNINIKNSDGDTPFQLCFKYKHDLELINLFLKLGANVNVRNNLGRSPLHDAAKYSKYGIESFEPLLQHGASVNAFDYNGNSPLHDIFHNPSVSIDAVQLLLSHGAHPDWRNLENCPPVSCVQTSTLSILEKSYATKLLIQYTSVRKFNVLKARDDWTTNDAILSLDFCEGTNQFLDLLTIRDQCVKGLIVMNKYYLKENYSLFDLLFEYCYDINNFKKQTDEFLIENVTGLVMDNDYPCFNYMLFACATDLSTEALFKNPRGIALKPSSKYNVHLNLECAKAMSSFLS